MYGTRHNLSEVTYSITHRHSDLWETPAEDFLSRDKAIRPTQDENMSKHDEVRPQESRHTRLQRADSSKQMGSRGAPSNHKLITPRIVGTSST